MSANISSRLLSGFSFNSTSISELLTGSTCSSNSARPVLLLTNSTSGTFSINFSAMVPILLLSSKDVPAGVDRLIVKEPSLNGGKNSVPKNGTIAHDAIIKRTDTPIICLGRLNPKCSNFVSCFFNHLTNLLSCSASFFGFLFSK